MAISDGQDSFLKAHPLVEATFLLESELADGFRAANTLAWIRRIGTPAIVEPGQEAALEEALATPSAVSRVPWLICRHSLHGWSAHDRYTSVTRSVPQRAESNCEAHVDADAEAVVGTGRRGG